MEFHLPEGAYQIIARLRAHGYAAYAVGGCVRDTLLGISPKDWDICTAATPEQMQAVFDDWRTVETGLKHGTLTVLYNHEPYEVTTFRVDGAYTDHRHPDSVRFVDSLADDLARRDFTVNAMAWSDASGLQDLWGGQADLAAELIRCVGEPRQRFEEDALRILRALRFAAVYGFHVEEATANAIHRMYPALHLVAPERIRVELCKLICGQAAGNILRAYPDVITFLLPELAACVGFAQHNPHHLYDVWEHTIRAVEAAPPTETLRLTLLLHDCGKPDCFSLDAAGIGHAHGHAARSAALAEHALNRLRMDHQTRDRVLLLIAHHGDQLAADDRLLTRALNRLGEEALRQLIEVQCADGLAKGTVPAAEACAERDALVDALNHLLAAQPAFTLKQLAVNGEDLLRAGVPRGRSIGQTLNALLSEVMDGHLLNERDQLLHSPIVQNAISSVD